MTLITFNASHVMAYACPKGRYIFDRFFNEILLVTKRETNTRNLITKNESATIVNL